MVALDSYGAIIQLISNILQCYFPEAACMFHSEAVKIKKKNVNIVNDKLKEFKGF